MIELSTTHKKNKLYIIKYYLYYCIKYLIFMVSLCILLKAFFPNFYYNTYCSLYRVLFGKRVFMYRILISNENLL